MRRRLAFLAAILLTAAPASAVTLDFDRLTSRFYFAPLTMGEYRFDSTRSGFNYEIVQRGGSRALRPFSGATHTIRRLDNAAFDAFSIDIAARNSAAQTVVWKGRMATGGTACQTLSAPARSAATTPALETIALAGFRNLLSLSFTTPVNTGELVYDNLIIDEAAIPLPTIPAPATFPLLASALLGFLAIGIRRRG